MNQMASQIQLSSVNANKSSQVNKQKIQSLSNGNFNNYQIPPFEEIS